VIWITSPFSVLSNLRRYDDGRLILASMADIAPILYDLKLPVKRYVHEGAKPFWNDAITDARPEKVVGWVLMSQNDRVWMKLHDDLEFRKHFVLIGHYGLLELYRLKIRKLTLVNAAPIIHLDESNALGVLDRGDLVCRNDSRCAIPCPSVRTRSACDTLQIVSVVAASLSPCNRSTAPHFAAGTSLSGCGKHFCLEPYQK
jgi:hypothetical protein